MYGRAPLLLTCALLVRCAGERPPASDARRPGDGAAEHAASWPDGVTRSDGPSETRPDGAPRDHRAPDKGAPADKGDPPAIADERRRG